MKRKAIKAKSKFVKYKGYEGKRTEFTVFIIHGHDDVFYREVQKFIESKLKFRTIVLKDEFNGKTIIEKLQHKIWEEVDCAIAVMSADDKLKSSLINPRPNVLFEIGYCLGYFDQLYVDDLENEIRPVVLIKEDRTQIPSDLNGMELIDYSRGSISNAKKRNLIYAAVEQRLRLLLKQVIEYYKEQER